LVDTDRRVLEMVTIRESEYNIKLFKLEQELFQGDGTEVVFEQKTHEKSLEKYNQKIQAKIAKLMKKKLEKMRKELKRRYSLKQ
jgi:hypothetical protein